MSAYAEEADQNKQKAAEQSSTAALEFAAISEAEKKGLREELSKYLVDLKDKKDSNGENLVQMSDDFDAVAAAMTREDLLSNEAAPWSKYLLSSDQSFEINLDKGGRYTGLDEKEGEEAIQAAQLRKAMARMELLEKQLENSAKKDTFVRNELLDLEHRQQIMEGGDDDTVSESSYTSSTASSRKGSRGGRSVISRFNDYTFLTKAKSDRSASRESELESLPSSPMHSARTVESNVSELDHEDGGEEAEREEAKLSTPERNALVAERAAKKKKDAIELKKRALHGRSALSDDEQLRVRNLLDVDEDSEQWQMLRQYGASSQHEAMQELDGQLVAYGRVRRLRGEDGVSPTRSESKDGGGADADYLARQRVLRERNQNLSRIDAMIRMVKDDDTDLSTLVDQRAPSASARGVSLLEVPNYDDVDPTRKLTHSDISRLVDEIMLARSMDDAENTDLNAQALAAHPETSPSSSMAESEPSRLELDRLLNSVRPEVLKLGKLREALHAVMDSHGEYRSQVKDGGLTQTEARRALEDLDDELVDITNQYARPPEKEANNLNGKSLAPLEGANNLHSKLQSLRAKLGERGVYCPAREATDNKQLEPPQVPVSSGMAVGLDPRVRRSRDEDKGEGGKLDGPFVPSPPRQSLSGEKLVI